MKRLSIRQNEQGSVILIVVLVLIAISALSLTMINFTTVEVNMAGNYKFDKAAFTAGDSGIYGTPPFIDVLMREGAPIQAQDPSRTGCLEFLNTTDADTATELRNRVYGFAGDDATAAFNTPANEDDPAAADISYRPCDIPADINIIPRGSLQMSGGGVEFSAGAEGIGAGGASGAAKIYRLVSTGSDQQNTRHTVRAVYRWVDVAGGK